MPGKATRRAFDLVASSFPVAAPVVHHLRLSLLLGWLRLVVNRVVYFPYSLLTLFQIEDHRLAVPVVEGPAKGVKDVVLIFSDLLESVLLGHFRASFVREN